MTSYEYLNKVAERADYIASQSEGEMKNLARLVVALAAHLRDERRASLGRSPVPPGPPAR